MLEDYFKEEETDINVLVMDSVYVPLLLSRHSNISVHSDTVISKTKILHWMVAGIPRT